jgi:hypothetical protein
MYTLYPTYVMRDDGAAIPIDVSNVDYQGYLDWIAEGNTPAAPPAPTFADYVQAFLPQFQSWMEQVAWSNQYDSVLSCLSYLTSSVPQYKGDADALLAWRDALWVWAQQWEAGFNGQVPATIPTFDEVKALAPQPEAFDWVVHQTGNVIPGSGTQSKPAGQAGL